MKLELAEIIRNADAAHVAALNDTQYFHQLSEMSLAILDMAECVARGTEYINDRSPVWQVACQRVRNATLALPEKYQFQF